MFTTPRRRRSVGVLVLLAAALPAQTGGRLLGLTEQIPSILNTDVGACVQTSCALAGFPAATAPSHGGAAYDATTRGLWITNGLVIGRVDPRGGCAEVCSVAPIPRVSASNPATGLAHSAATQQLFVTDASNNILIFRTSGCALSFVSRCAITPPVGEVLSGAACDDSTGTLFYCTADPTGAGGTVFAAPLSDPCNPFCRIPLDRCAMIPLTGLTGLAYDACQKTLYVAGRIIVQLRFDRGSCAFTGSRCCVSASNDPMVGLGWMPPTEASVGTSCTAGACTSCPAMVHALRGDPVVGSASFRVTLENAPAGAVAFLALGAGACTPPGLSLPSFCGPILAPVGPTTTVFGPVPAVGSTGCTGVAALSLRIPANPSLCGAPLGSQMIGLCGTGTLVSNCLSWQVSS